MNNLFIETVNISLAKYEKLNSDIKALEYEIKKLQNAILIVYNVSHEELLLRAPHIRRSNEIPSTR